MGTNRSLYEPKARLNDSDRISDVSARLSTLIAESGRRNAFRQIFYAGQEIKMRMPVLSYFVFTGTVLFALLFWVSAELNPNSLPIRTSQIVGVPEPFKPQPEQRQYKVGNINFAAAQEPSRPTPTAVTAVKQKATNRPSKIPMWSRYAESQHDDRSFH